MTENNIELSIVIVSYNTQDLLFNCLKSLFAQLNREKLEDRTQVVVVDNASKDKSVKLIQNKFPKVKLIKNCKNEGFAKANNQGIMASLGKYILLLNSDTRIKKNALTSLLQLIKNNQEIGVVGGKLLNEDSTIQPSVGFFPNLSKVFFWMSFIDDLPFVWSLVKPYHVENVAFYQKRQNVDWISAACFLFRSDILAKSGYLDENIFMYGEEVEWCYRIKDAGFSIVYAPQAEIIHVRGGSSKDKVDSGIVDEFKSIIYFYKKHMPLWQLPIVRKILLMGAWLRIAVFGIIRRYPARIKLYAKAIELFR